MIMTGKWTPCFQSTWKLSTTDGWWAKV